MQTYLQLCRWSGGEGCGDGIMGQAIHLMNLLWLSEFLPTCALAVSVELGRGRC